MMIAHTSLGSIGQTRFKAMVNYICGCDKSCPYCIGPPNRGDEISIPKDISKERWKGLVKNGCHKEVIPPSGQNGHLLLGSAFTAQI